MIRDRLSASAVLALVFAVPVTVVDAVNPQKGRPKPAEVELSYPPQLPGGKAWVTVEGDALLQGPSHIAADVTIAEQPPRVELLYFPGQAYPGKPWSNWGDSLAVGDKYYASIGDHLAPRGNAFVYEYDPQLHKFRRLADVAKTLKLPDGHYVPGKIHTRLDMGSDGWLYFGTHRGSTRVTDDRHHYLGDWIMRCHPKSGRCELVDRNPVPKHCIPTSITDGKRMVFYGSTAAGSDAKEQGIQFFAYDLVERKAIYRGGDGPARSIALATDGTVYFTPGTSDAPLMKFQSWKHEAPVAVGGQIGFRAATSATADGIIYTASKGGRGEASRLYSLNTRTDEINVLAPAAVGNEQYIATLDVDSTGRFLYYVPGAHGGSYRDGTPIVQFDTKTKRKKVLAFLEPVMKKQFGCSLRGTYSIAIAPTDDKLFITWNASRGSRHWDCCALTVVHIPESER